jgi:CHC2 zinc finger
VSRNTVDLAYAPSLQFYDDHYHCFGCGAHGDAIDWLRDIEGMDYSAAAELLSSWSGPVAQSRPSVDARTLAFALRLWEAARPIAGTLAIKYLADIRGIDVDALPPEVDQVLRFHPFCPFGPGTSHPCVLALFRDVEGDAPAGIHRIALTPETLAGGKVERRMLGRWPTARAIKLWPAGSRLFVAEGIETALAAATRLQFHGGPMQGMGHRLERHHRQVSSAARCRAARTSCRLRSSGRDRYRDLPANLA